MVVLPAASRPTMRIRISFLPNYHGGKVEREREREREREETKGRPW
jgi:hypothetical protein